MHPSVTPPTVEHCTCPPLCTDDLRCDFCKSPTREALDTWCREFVDRLSQASIDWLDDDKKDICHDDFIAPFTAELSARFPGFPVAVVEAAERISRTAIDDKDVYRAEYDQDAKIVARGIDEGGPTLPEFVALARRFSNWFEGWCPNQNCCAGSGLPIHNDAVKLLDKYDSVKHFITLPGIPRGKAGE